MSDKLKPWRWITLERVDRLVGLLAKFTTIIVGLVALDFFTMGMRPHIESSIEVLTGNLDKDAFRASYISEGKTIPPIIEYLLLERPSRPAFFPTSALYEEAKSSERLRTFLEERFQTSFPFPDYVGAILGFEELGELTPEETTFAIEVLRGTMYTIVQVTVFNSGRAEAHDVSLQLSPSPNFTLEYTSHPLTQYAMCSELDPTRQPFNLKPGKSITFCFKQPSAPAELPIAITDFTRYASYRWWFQFMGLAEDAIKVNWDSTEGAIVKDVDTALRYLKFSAGVTVVIAILDLSAFLRKEYKALERKRRQSDHTY